MPFDIDKITESTASRATSRISTVLLGVMVPIIGYFVVTMLSDIKDTQKLFSKQIVKTSSTLSEIKEALAVTNANMASHVKDDDSFETEVKNALQDHEMRLRAYSK